MGRLYLNKAFSFFFLKADEDGNMPTGETVCWDMSPALVGTKLSGSPTPLPSLWPLWRPHLLKKGQAPIEL